MINSKKMKIDTLQTATITNPFEKKVEKQDGGLFDKMLDVVNDMNTKQVQANSKMQDVLTGKSDDTSGALIAQEQSTIQMQLAVTVRDKLTQEYQQIINMQL